MKSENREIRARQIEVAAYNILDEKGFSGLSIQAVAQGAKASNETLYRWYGDKTGLFEALIKGNSAIVEAAIATPDNQDPSGQLQDVGRVLLSMLLGPRAIALNRAAAADTTGTLGRALAREGRDTIAPRIVAMMRSATSDGHLAGGTPEEMAETFFALLIGDLQIRRVTGALQDPRPEFINRRATTAVERLRLLFPPT